MQRLLMIVQCKLGPRSKGYSIASKGANTEERRSPKVSGQMQPYLRWCASSSEPRHETIPHQRTARIVAKTIFWGVSGTERYRSVSIMWTLPPKLENQYIEHSLRRVGLQKLVSIQLRTCPVNLQSPRDCEPVPTQC